MSEFIKPCPFCGGQPKFYTVIERYVDTEDCEERWKVVCGAREDCCYIVNDFATKQAAIEAWNRRFRG